jgi:hypothetical protein
MQIKNMPEYGIQKAFSKWMRGSFSNRFARCFVCLWGYIYRTHRVSLPLVGLFYSILGLFYSRVPPCLWGYTYRTRGSLPKRFARSSSLNTLQPAAADGKRLHLTGDCRRQGTRPGAAVREWTG